jgi:hypothetical protein
MKHRWRYTTNLVPETWYFVLACDYIPDLEPSSSSCLLTMLSSLLVDSHTLSSSVRLYFVQSYDTPSGH